AKKEKELERVDDTAIKDPKLESTLSAPVLQPIATMAVPPPETKSERLPIPVGETPSNDPSETGERKERSDNSESSLADNRRSPTGGIDGEGAAVPITTAAANAA